MIKNFRYIILIVATIAFLGCDKNTACFKGSGTTITEVRKVESFEKIFLDNNINLTIKQGAEISLSVTGGENLLTRIVTKVEEGQLKIFSENKCSFLRKYDAIDVNLTVPNLTNLDYEGHGDVVGVGELNFPEFSFDSKQGTGDVDMNLKTDQLYIRQHTGPADFKITGETKNLYAYTNGNGWVKMEGLIADFAHVSCNGTGDVFVRATNELRVELRHTGSVHYYGDPTLEVTEHTGSGKIVKK